MGPHAPARAGRHGDVVLEPAAESLAPSSGWTVPGQHVHDLAHPARSRPELAEEPHVVPDRGGEAPAQAGHGQPRRSGCGGKKGLIEQAYTLGAQLGLSVWCEDEAGPFQAVPHPGASWQPEGRPATQPHEYIRGGTSEILAALPVPKASLDPVAAWAVWQGGLAMPFTLPQNLPPLRLLLVWDNLAGHKTPDLVLWLCAHGVMPLYTPVGGSWLNMAESIERVLKRRALDGQHPHSPDEIGRWFEQTARCWNEQPTPFVWTGKRRQRRRRSGGEPIPRPRGAWGS